jgi:hypothetical protein
MMERERVEQYKWGAFAIEMICSGHPSSSFFRV